MYSKSGTEETMKNKTSMVSALSPTPTVGNSKSTQRNTFKIKKTPHIMSTGSKK